jgi:hypothetical protein
LKLVSILSVLNGLMEKKLQLRLLTALLGNTYEQIGLVHLETI